MKLSAGQVAVVTGGGSGIGEAMVRSFAKRGLKTVVVDVDLAAAKQVADSVGGVALRVDVSDRQQMTALADRCFDDFGAVHVLCLNAGVAPTAPVHTLTAQDWRFGLGVNLDGISNGLLAFLPRMRSQDDPAHIVNTASMAGVTAIKDHAIYCASKHAAVALSDVVRAESKNTSLSSSVLCPAMVRTKILKSERNRPAALGTGVQGRRSPLHRALWRVMATIVTRTGIKADVVGEDVCAGIEADDPYIFTHHDEKFVNIVDRRQKRVLEAITAAAPS